MCTGNERCRCILDVQCTQVRELAARLTYSDYPELAPEQVERAAPATSLHACSPTASLHPYTPTASLHPCPLAPLAPLAPFAPLRPLRSPSYTPLQYPWHPRAGAAARGGLRQRAGVRAADDHGMGRGVLLSPHRGQARLPRCQRAHTPLGGGVRRRRGGICMVYAWCMHGMCMACAWHVHGMCRSARCCRGTAPTSIHALVT